LNASFDLLLASMHAVGTELSESQNQMRKHWGLHLLEDWRSLELLADKLREQPESVQPRSETDAA